MKSILALVLCAFFGITAFAQNADINTPTTLTSSFYTTGTTVSSSLNASVPSGLATMSMAPGTDDVFFEFTAETQGIKINVICGTFDAIIELWDDASNMLVGADDIGIGGTEEIWYTTLTPGNTYTLRVYSADGVGAGVFDVLTEHLPACNLRDNFIPTSAAFDAADGVDGYRLSDVVSRDPINTSYGYPININPLVEDNMFRITNTATNDVHIHQGAAGFALNSVTDNGLLCPNEEYTVECQVMLEGKWCGYSEAPAIYTEAEPVAVIQDTWANQEYSMFGSIQMNNLGQGQDLVWFLSTDNGNVTLDPYQSGNSASTWINFNEITCLRYSRIYDITVQATYCDITGPMSDPITVYIEPYPKTQLLPEFSTGQLLPGQLILAEPIFKAEQYVFQFTPMTPGDENMIPIGPAILAYSDGASTSMAPLGLTVGSTYRIGVKSFIQYGDGCDDPQESDYGAFVETLIVSSLDPVDVLIDFNEDTDYLPTETPDAIAKVDQPRHNQRQFILDISEENLEGTGFLDVYTMSGRLVHTRPIYELEHADMLIYELHDELSTGAYIYSLKAGDKTYSQKVYVP